MFLISKLVMIFIIIIECDPKTGLILIGLSVHFIIRTGRRKSKKKNRKNKRAYSYVFMCVCVGNQELVPVNLVDWLQWIRRTFSICFD